jgi:hypothetical protein
MWLVGAPPDSAVVLAWASGYERAMHGTCIRCHEREREAAGKPALADCGTCHPSLRADQQYTMMRRRGTHESLYSYE